MTNDELRALADALEPMAKAPRFEDFDVPAFCAWLRAQAEAEPVAWIVEHGPTRRLTFFDEAPGKVGTGVSIPLYTHPAPAVPQADALPVSLVRAYNAGYMAGHHDTVEGGFVDIHPSDMDTYHADVVAELGLPAVPQAEPIDPHMIVADDRFPDAQSEPKRKPACLWSRADDDTDVWETSCGHAFTIIEGTPSDNHMEFCCYCGRRVDEEIGGSDE